MKNHVGVAVLFSHRQVKGKRYFVLIAFVEGKKALSLCFVRRKSVAKIVGSDILFMLEATIQADMVRG